jgi:hypothetical protein
MPANPAADTLRPLSVQDQVECHSGHTYAERPVALVFAGQRREIVEVLASWQIPGARCFRILADDLSTYELCYDEIHDEWQIIHE